MKQEIKITVLGIDKDDDDFTKYRITISNGIISASLDFYAYPDSFKEFAIGLISFPKSVDDVVTFQVGEDNDQWAHFLHLKAYCHERNGNSIMHIKITKNGALPGRCKADFYISAEAGFLQNLGISLSKWNPETQKEIIWTHHI